MTPWHVNHDRAGGDPCGDSRVCVGDVHHHRAARWVAPFPLPTKANALGTRGLLQQRGTKKRGISVGFREVRVNPWPPGIERHEKNETFAGVPRWV